MRKLRTATPKFFSLLTTVVLVGLPFAFEQNKASASSPSVPSCAEGAGVGGTNNATASLTAGGDGCVVIKYLDGATVSYVTFNYTGVDQTWTVPSGVSSATFFLLGAGGGGVPMSGTYGDGGGGGYAAGTYALTAGEVLRVIVGRGGGGELLALESGVGTNGCYRSAFVFGGGGQGASCNGSGLSYPDRASSGGGRSAIRLANDTEIATAGGGGGGGWSGDGGPGGGTSGGAGRDAGPGTQSAGGTTANALATPGAQFIGGNGYHQGGGGGAGFFGGGGGYSVSGGGGGSSFIASLTDGVTIAGVGTNPGGAINALAVVATTCADNAGRGGAASNTLANTMGGHGCVAIKYEVGGHTVYETFNYTGADQTWVAPSGVSSATFYLVGAGGGGATGNSHGAGGGGGYARGNYAITPGESYTVIVGQAGGGELGVTGTVFSSCMHTRLKYGGGGQGGSCLVGGWVADNSYSSGGGRSAIRVAGGTSDIATAGGGGGGGYGATSNGGGGGGTSGFDGGGSGGKGGTHLAGGARGYSQRNNGTPGGSYQGGRSDDEGGGGGGGYFGGGGAGDNGGGGGGSSYVALLTNSATVAGSGVSPGGNINTLATADITPPAVTLAASSSTSTVGTISFTVTGNEPINCATLSTTSGTDFTWTGISSITAISQTSANVCTITALSTATNDGLAVTSALTRASTFSIADTAGNTQIALSGSPQATVVTIPDTIAPTVSFTAVSITATSRAVSFAVTGNEAIDCATLSVVDGEDFVFTNISEITSIVQTSPTVCTVNGRSTAINGGGSVTSALTAAASFSITDVAGNTQTTLSGSPKSVVVTVPIEVPAALSAEALDGEARISFTMGDDGGTPITNYMYSLNGGSFVALNPADGTSPITIPGLTNGTTYTIALKAVNAAGTGSVSSSVTVTPMAAPSAPTNVWATFDNAQSAVSWDASVDNGGSAILDYVVTASPGGNTCTTPDASTLTCVVAGLTNGITYTFSVVARNAVGDSPSSTSSLPMTPRTTPDAPTNVTGIVGNTESYVSWSASTDDGGSEILNYVVTASPGGRTCTTPDGTTLSCVVTGLTNGTAYTFTVNALNAAGYSPGATSVTAVTPSAITAPSKPISISASVSNGVVTMSWSVPLTDGGSPIIDYAIEFSTDGGTTWELFNDDVSTAASATLTGLASGKSYRFRVIPINSVGHGISSPITEEVVVVSVPPPSQNPSPSDIPRVTAPDVVTPVIAEAQQPPPSTVILGASTSVGSTTSTTVPNTKISRLNTLPNTALSYSTVEMAKIVDDVAAVAGMPKDGWVKVEKTATEFVVSTSDGLRVVIAARKKTDNPNSFNSRGMPIFSAGDLFLIGGGGLMPNTVASTWLFSTPTKLGELTTNAQGAFEESYPIGENFPPGDHTAQLNAIAPDGTLRVLEVKVEIIAPDAAAIPVAVPVEDAPPAPSAPPISPAEAVTLLATAFVLIAASKRSSSAASQLRTAVTQSTALAAGARRRENSEEEGDDDGVEREEASGDVASVSAGYAAAVTSEKADLYAPFRVPVIDALMKKLAMGLDRALPMFARIANDGAAIRALTGAPWALLPLIGMILGVVSAFNTDFTIMIPALWIIAAVLVLGILDAFAGLLFAVTFTVVVLMGGGFESANSIRGLLGISVFAFAPALVASSVRPFRRLSDGQDLLWNRIVDFVLVVLFGAWTAGGMYSALPSLTTFKPLHSDRIDFIHVVAIAALVIRWAIENSARLVTPNRLRDVEVVEFDDPPLIQQYVSQIVRTAVFTFVIFVFIGNNWALWTSAALFLVPKIIGEFAARFPNVPALHKFLPKKLTKVVFMMFVMTWWGGVVSDRWADSADALLYIFVLMNIPGLVMDTLSWFGREGSNWKSTILSKIAGIVILILGFLIVRGVIVL